MAIIKLTVTKLTRTEKTEVVLAVQRYVHERKKHDSLSRRALVREAFRLIRGDLEAHYGLEDAVASLYEEIEAITPSHLRRSTLDHFHPQKRVTGLLPMRPSWE